MKRKLFTFLLAIAASIGLTYAETVQIGDLSYVLDATNKTAAVTQGDYSSLTTANIPASVEHEGQTYSVTSIGYYAFNGCSGMTSVTIPNSVTSIGYYAFNNVANIVYNGSAKGSPWGARSVNGYVDGNLVYKNETKKELLACFSSATGEITIPNSVTNIGQHTFVDCSGLTTVTIPNSVTYIGYYAFKNCSNLTSVTIPNSVTDIYSYTFYGCSSLTSMTIPSSVTSIGEYAFDGCSSLTSVTIPNSVTSIGESAFSGCSSLTSVTIPNSVTSIEFDAFSGCSSLNSISVESGNTVYDSRDNSNAIIETASNSLIVGCKNTIIPNSVTRIGESAFSGCSSLTSVTIGNSVTSIGYGAFRGCSNLKSVVWNAKNCDDFSSTNTPFYFYFDPSIFDDDNFDLRSHITSFSFGEEVEHIPAYLCSGLSNLTSITIPNSVTSIGNEAFSGCSGLTSVTFGNSVTSIGSRAFQDCSSLTTVVWNAKNCNDFSSGNTPFYFYNSNNGFDLRQQITSLTFGDEVEHIPAYLCYGMSNLLMATIPNSATSIGNGAFRNCSGLTSLAIPNGVTSIGDDAFTSCSNMTQITIPEGVRYIGSNAFALCYKLSEVQIPNSVTEIGYMTFWMCESLQSIVIPDNVTAVGNEAFYYCSALESITFGKGLTYFGDKVLMGCSKLKDVVWKAIRCQDFTDINTPFYYYQPKTKTQKAKVVYDIRAQITSFTFGDDVEYIPAYLCWGLTNVPEIVVPDCHIEMGTYALEGTTHRAIGAYNIVYPDTTLCYEEDLYLDGVKCDLVKQPWQQTWTRRYQTINGCDSIVSISVLWSRAPYSYEINIESKDVIDNPKSGSIKIKGADAGQYDYYVYNGRRNASMYNLSAGEHKITFVNELCDDSTTLIVYIRQYGIRIDGKYYLLDYENHTATLTYRGTSYSAYSGEYSGNLTIPKKITIDGEEYQVTGINSSTFSGCSNIKSITIESEAPITMPWNSGLSNSCVIYVPYGSLSAYKSSSNWSDYNIHVIDPTHAVATCGATSASIVVGNEDEQKHIVSCGINGAEEFDGNVIEYCGLEPETTCSNVSFKVKTIEGDIDEVICSFTTTALELNTQPARLTSESSAVLVAYTNMADIETSCGFEFRRTGASDLVPSQMMNCAIANGTMAVKVNNIKAGVEYKYRPYYTSKQGNTKYGDWTAFDPIDAYIEYEPIVCTQTATGVTNSKATMRAMVVEGSSAISEQGFDVCAVGRQINNAQGAPRRAHKSVIGEHWTVPAEGTNMKVTLTDLDEGTTYTYRTYVIINGDTIFGSEQSFTTLGEYLYTVTFVDYDGTILGTDKVHYGDAATAPEDPIREGYEFTGWDNDFSNVTDDLTITATYSIATALPETTATQSKAQKLLHDGQLFIVLPDGTRYTATGMKVE